jgi:NADH-quinone oxidoreductase subunit D
MADDQSGICYSLEECFGDEMVLNMGPHHPSTHGVLRFVLHTDGEVINRVEPDIGYLHRGMEKIAEGIRYPQFMPYTDRVDYCAAMNCNWAYCLAVEKMMGTEVPRRAEFIRVIVGELNRMSSHFIAIGSMSNDIGASTPFVYALRMREKVNDLFEMLCGARLTYNYMRLGGVSRDLPEGFVKKTRDFLEYLEPKMEQFNDLITYQHIFINRLANVAVITEEQAIGFGLSGPNLRGSGVDFDIRKNEPYSIYPELDFMVPVGTGEVGTVGDCYDRYMVRIREIRESAKIVSQCLDELPEGELRGEVPRKIKPADGTEVYVRSEAPRGEMGYYIISDGSEKPYRLRIRAGSFSAMSIITEVSRGLMIADLVALIGSLDIIAPEVDR